MFARKFVLLTILEAKISGVHHLVQKRDTTCKSMKAFEEFVLRWIVLYCYAFALFKEKNVCYQYIWRVTSISYFFLRLANIGCTFLGPGLYLAPAPPDNWAKVLPAVLFTPKSASLAPSGLLLRMAESSAR